MVAGGKLFESAFGADYRRLSYYAFGIWLTLGVVLIYTVLRRVPGGQPHRFRPGRIMFVALVLMPLVALFGLGGGGLARVADPARSTRRFLT